MPTTTVHVVAAGIVRGDGTNRGPVLNNLAARTMVNGELRLRFNEYRPPSPGGKAQYLVPRKGDGQAGTYVQTRKLVVVK